jgi:hypothetical protein
MKEQKVIVISGDTYDIDKQREINDQLKLDWSIVSVTAQHVAGTNGTIYGGYLIVFERDK